MRTKRMQNNTLNALVSGSNESEHNLDFNNSHISESNLLERTCIKML